MRPKHQAVAAGLALTLAFGALGAPALSYAQDADDRTVEATDSLTSDNAAESGDDAALPAPGDYDRSLDYEEAPVEVPSIMLLSLNSLLSSRAASISPEALSSEMKYFAENESGSNYDQGFSYGDGYNAMGVYQFDRRYSLLPFLEACYSYNPEKYAMFKPVIDRGSELKSGAIYDSGTRKLTEIGQMAEDAWHAAYANDATEFAALQDNFAYQEYYLPVQSILANSFGVDISGRADCVKGLCWSLANLFGTGGCQRFFRIAELSEDMSDREFVNALCDAVVNNVDGYAYGSSYRARYERERATCLSYISEDEQQSGQPEQGEDAGETVTPEEPSDGSVSEPDADAPADEDGGDASEDEAPETPEPGGSDDSAAEDEPAQDDETAGDTDGDTSGDIGLGSTDSAGDDQSEQPSDETPSDDAGQPVDETPADEGDSSSDQDSGTGADDGADAPDGDAGGAVTGGDDFAAPGDSGTAGPGEDASSNKSGSEGSATPDANADGSAETGSESGQPAGEIASGQQGQNGNGGATAQGGKKVADPAAEPTRLPATSDATVIGFAVSSILSVLGAASVIAGNRLRGARVPFEDGFRG